MKIITIGRSPESNIFIDDNSVSRNHAKILVGNGKIILEDLNSANGTYVNNSKIIKTEISLNDSIKLGKIEFNLSAYLHLLKEEGSGYRTQFVNVNDNVSAEKLIKIGRLSDNDIIINDPYISSYHAVIRKSKSGLVIEDFNSTNGTYVNKKRVKSSKISFNDAIHFGSYKFSLERFSGYFKDSLSKDISKDISNISVSIKEGINRVGRTIDNEIVINHPSISAHHASICKKGNVYEIEDLNSRNGVYINGRKIIKSIISSDDKVTLGIYPINISSENVLKTYKGDVKLDLKTVNFEVTQKGAVKQILSDISLTVFPSEFVGLIGPSGSGKTTLLNIINGYSIPSVGEVLINSNNLHSNYELFRGNIGFVPQDDIIHRELTVYESLFYSAKLRLPADLSDAEINQQVDNILAKLDLTKARDVIIGSPEKTGISGGQRKRVNLAQELITQPSLLLLDEPTSGLDPKTDHEIMILLRKLADEGRIIILTTHHITEENFKLFDNIILLTNGGKLAYYGPSYPDSTNYFQVKNPQEIFSCLDEKVNSGDNQRKYRDSNYFHEYVENRKLNTKELLFNNQNISQKQKREFDFRQFFVLLRRYFTIKKSDTLNSLILFLQAPLLGLLVGVTIGKGNEQSILPPFINPVFVMIICSIFFGVLNTSREIVSERAIYFRERMVMLKIPSYIFSKYFLLTLISIFQSVTLVFIVYNLCGLKGNIVFITFNIIILSLSSMSMGLLLSSFVKTPEAAISISIFALIPQIIFAGVVIPLGDMAGFVNSLSYLMLSRWSFESIIRNEATSQNAIPRLESLKFIGTDDNTLLCVIAVLIWGVAYLSIVTVLLKMRDKV